MRRDPASALDGGEAGWEIIERLIAESSGLLDGLLALEIGHDQGARLRQSLGAHGYRDIQIAADYQGRDRFAFAYHGVANPFYLGSAPSAHVRPRSSRGWRTLYRYGRAKHMLAIAFFVLLGLPSLVAFPLALLWPYIIAIFLKASWTVR